LSGFIGYAVFRSPNAFAADFIPRVTSILDRDGKESLLLDLYGPACPGANRPLTGHHHCSAVKGAAAMTKKQSKSKTTRSENDIAVARPRSGEVGSPE
jgi:hypothetical protein